MKIAIAGYGIEGRANYDYYKTRGDITIVDEREVAKDIPEGAMTILGVGAFEKLLDFDIVLRSAGVAPHKIRTNGKVWSGTNEFLMQCQTPIIGVTGTKGKGTTASLIHSILLTAGKKSLLVGNIGQPALAVLKEANASDVIVYEMSSFQLWDAEKSPEIAVVLMIEPDHLDVHKDMQEYIDAKKNIRRFQSADDSCIYHPTNKNSHEIAAASLEYASEEARVGGMHFAARYAVATEKQVYVENDYFCVQDRKICSVNELQLPGQHNKDNACAAMSAVFALFADISDEDFAQGLHDFTGLPHRLKRIATIAGVTYYDDSIATTPGSAIAALESFDESKVIILGGSDKGANYAGLIEACLETHTTVIAIGQTGGVIQEMCVERGVHVIRPPTMKMQAIIQAAKDASQPGGIVILSPASASFDMFASYSDRGEKFIEAVNNMQKVSNNDTAR